MKTIDESFGNLPLCNLWVNPETLNYEVDHCEHPLEELIPVFKSPKLEPLTKHQIDAIGKTILDHGFHEWEGLQPWVFTFVKAIEAAHGITK
jgi:hypothetical protein